MDKEEKARKSHEWYLRNKERLSLKFHQYYEQHKEEIKKNVSVYKKEHRLGYNELNRLNSGYISKEQKHANSKRGIVKRQELVNNIKVEKGCKVCGERDVNKLLFHHPNMDKLNDIKHLKCYSKETLLKEIEKCIVLCRKCHCMIHLNKENRKGFVKWS